ncbi:MAG: mechanosensitive ion channel family protein [Rhodanobacter sp.]
MCGLSGWPGFPGESPADLIVRAWTRSGDFLAARTDLPRAIKDHFDKVGISILLPQRQLTVVDGKLTTATAKKS